MLLPSNVAGAHWGGVAVDPAAQIAVVPVNTIASMVRLIPRAEFDTMGRETHGRIGDEFARMRGTPYGMYREPLFSDEMVPCTPPPFGGLIGVDLRSGTIAWRTPLGGRATAAGSSLGTANLGGAITTAGALTVIGGTLDPVFRAFETRTGRELWHATLPAGAKATPMSFAGRDGRQFVVIAAGGDGGEYRWHVHPDSDELFIVVDGVAELTNLRPVGERVRGRLRVAARDTRFPVVARLLRAGRLGFIGPHMIESSSITPYQGTRCARP